MPNFIVLRLMPAVPVDEATFAKYLDGLTVKVYDISYAHPDAGKAGDPTPPLGTAKYNPGTPNVPKPVGSPPFVTYPANTTIAQHYGLTTALGEVIGVDFQSVATAVIQYPGGGPEYVAPDLRIVFERAGASPFFDANVYYDVPLYPAGGAPDPSTYQEIPAANVSAYLTLKAPLDPALAQLDMAADGTPPNYDALMTAVASVLKKDPGGAPTQTEIAQLSVEQCRNIAYEIVYGPREPLPIPTDQIEKMYTNPPNDGSNTNSDEQSRQDFQGKLNSYYSTKNATAERLTAFVYSLACAVSCELTTKSASSALVTFPVNPGATTPGLATVGEADVILTGALGADVPAEYFYALTAQMPVQITPQQRYQMATTASQQQNLTRLKDALDAGIIVMPPTAPQPGVNPAQAVRLMTALAVPAGSPAVQCPVLHVQPIWSDWLAFPKTSPPPDHWKTFNPGDDITQFWPAEAGAQPNKFLDLALFVLTQGYVDPATATLLADEIKANLMVTPPAGPPPPPAHIANVGDLTKALPTDWQNFFAPGGVVNVNLLPPFTLPGTPADRVKAFIRYVQKFFQMPAPVPALGPGGADVPGSLHLPTLDLIQACLASFGGLVFGTPLTAADRNNLTIAAAATVPGDKTAQDWLVQTIESINDLAIMANLPGKSDGFRFSVMEALYARGFASADSALEHPLDNFQQALTGTVAYDYAATIYTNAGMASGFPAPGVGPFAPINPGSLTDCIPPLYLSPLGPIEYLHEMLKVSEASTCDAPFAPPDAGHTTLETAIGSRRGPLGDLAVSKANLETPLPRIDLVNECLEFMASTTPPTERGVVYDTASDALAGHVLCSGETCCEGGCNTEHHEDKERRESEVEHPEKAPACHRPASLFAALPEYSTPATPVTENVAVSPAVYNKLKLDFSACCQPYSQALDVSRTYLAHFRTCRFHAMRAFRRCITEFVLDPTNEPAGFQSHLWRYPVRIDTAIEYLGISPEVYAMLFQGAPPRGCGSDDDTNSRTARGQLAPWVLYGFTSGNLQERSWTTDVVRLPEFLQRTCLSYCEFLELWKTGVVPFRNGADREEGLFPECEPCCLDDYWLEFTEGEGATEEGLFKLGVFIRLWCILKHLCGARYSFRHLQDISHVLQLFIGNSVNPEFIRQLAAFQMLRDHFRMPLVNSDVPVAAGATGANRTHLLSLWVPGADQWDWAVKELIRRIAFYATCHHACERHAPEFEKLLEVNFDSLSRLAGFDPAVPANTWHALPTHTLRFAEVLAKIYASRFSIGEILYLFTAADHLDGDDPFPLQEQNEALDLPLGLPEDERRHSLWQLRRKLLDIHVGEHEVREWTWHRIAASLHDEFGYDPAEVRTFGEHFFPGILEQGGHPVPGAKRRFVSPLAPANTVPLMWNAAPRGPFRYDDAPPGQLWTQLPIADEEVIEQLTRVRALDQEEQQAVQDLYFQPRAMLARFAFIFADYSESEMHMIQWKNESERWELFRREFVLCHARGRAIARHLAEHVAAATGQEHPEGAEAARLVLSSLYGDENKAVAGAGWENDDGHAPAVTWNPAPNGSAWAALLGLTGTGLVAEYTPEGGALAWRAPVGAMVAFGRARDFRNCPVPTILPSLHLALKPEQMRFVSVHNGLAMKDATGTWLGGAQGFSVVWNGALLIERDGAYEFTAHALGRKEGEGDEREDTARRRWRITLKRGQKTWIVVSHHWPGESHRPSSSLPLREGAYELKVELVQPTPTFFDEDDLFPLHTGLQLKYAGPDTGGQLADIPHNRTLLVKKDAPLGDGIEGLSPGAAEYLSQLYVSSLRDIRRTYQRAFKALLFVHRAALSAHLRSGQSELGYMLAHKEKFAGASYYTPGGPYKKRNADFDFNLLPLEDNYYPPAGDARINPSLQRTQALFDWWERIFDYDRVRHEVQEHSDRHLWLLFEEAADKKPAHPAYLLRHMGVDSRHWHIDTEYFQRQTSPVYQLTSDDLEDDRWVVRVWHADQWIRALVRSFTAKDITKARPDLWVSDDPSAVLPGETVTGNGNLSQFVSDGCLENGLPLRYKDIEQLNNDLRERGRCALLAYLCGPAGIAKRPKELTELLLLDVEAGLHETTSRIDEAISAVQMFIQRSRLNLEPGWKISKAFALMWDRRFASYHAWEACKRRELYKENWIEWCEIEKAKKIEAFRFLDEELQRATLSIARPGGVDYWPDERPPRHPSLMFLQERQPSEMRLLPTAREGLDLLGAEERAGRPTWLTNVPESQSTPPQPPPNGTPGGIFLTASGMDVAPGGGAAGNQPKLPFWMESAVAMGTRFIRVAASGYPPAATAFRPRPEHKEADGKCCVQCCVECGKVHPLHVDEYYFWLVDGSFYEETTQDEHYDQNLQSAVPWHDTTQLKLLLEWPSNPTVRLAWCRVHNGEFGQPRRSEFGVPAQTGGALPDLTFQGRVGDSLYFDVTNAVAPTAGFRYDLATDSAVSSSNLTVPAAPPVPYPGGLFAYPYFAYLDSGARLFPWSLYAPAVAVAHSLRPHCRFEAALKWYALFYDPLQEDNTWMQCHRDTRPSTPPTIKEFTTAEVVGSPNDPGSMCCDTTDISCAVARNRSVLLHYLETLLQWSDATMRRNCPEAFEQARVILDVAARIMGPRPRAVTNAPAAVKQTVATFTPLFPSLNPRLMMLYDRLNDRLALIHAWINGRRYRNGILELDMPYFGNDPLREGWRSNCQVCPDEEDWCLPHSPYRFSVLVARARELTGRVREISAQLLSVFEKADAEYAGLLRARHDRELAVLSLQARQNQWRDSDWQVQALQKTKEGRQNDRRYYAQLIQNGLINNEQQYVGQVGIAQGDRTANMVAEGIAEAMSIIPDLFVGFPCEETWLPLGTKLSGLFQAVARISNTLAEVASTEGSLDLTEAGWDRRLQDWVHRVELLDIEIEQIELQILAAERRRAVALRELNLQQRRIEQAGELQDFLRDKFTSHAVYLCLQKELADLFCQAYELAYYTARQAQRAFNFERGHTTRRFLPESTWDNLHEGLLAGEKLDLALERMETEYQDRNVREEELTKHISLRLHFPIEFLRLKVTGQCEIEIPEWMFDLDYPGHFMRRIRNVSLTIPCVTGPYTGVHCRLTLLSSATRIDPLLRRPAARCCDACAMDSPYLACPHDPRVVRQYAARQAIATSTGRNDNGMFELNFHDDRYLPFEYQGAVSRWRIELPPENNFWDVDSLTDVIMVMNYTAREGGDLLRRAANEVAQEYLPGACLTFFDVRHDFPDAWELFRAAREEEPCARELVLRLHRKMFPFLPGREEIFVERVGLLFEEPQRCPDPCDAVSECPCPVEKKLDARTLDVSTCHVERHGRRDEVEVDMQCVAGKDWPELYHGIREIHIGPLAPHDGHHELKFRFPKDVRGVLRAYLFCNYRAERQVCRPREHVLREEQWRRG